MAKNKFSDNAREVLHYLQNTTHEDMTFRDIADAIEKPYRSVSAIITSLAKKGLVDRVLQENGDKFIVLTEDGRMVDPDETVEEK